MNPTTEQILKVIDNTSEFNLRNDLFKPLELEYIDTPGDYKENGCGTIKNYYRSSMNEIEFTKLLSLIETPKYRKVVYEFYNKYQS